MATVEGLFNFDEKLLARQVVKNRESAEIGAAAPSGWGPMMMGMNKIGNAIFNSDDKILKEQTIAQTSLKQVMEELGDDAKDSAKLYDALGQRLVENGASAETLMKLKAVASSQANDKANVDTANALKQSTFDLQKAKFQETQDKNFETQRKARLAEFNKTISDEDHPAAWLYKEALGQLAGGDSAADKEGALEFNGMVQKNVVEGGLSISDSIKSAKEEFGKKYKIKPDDSWWWFQDDNSKLQRRDGSDSTAINPKAQGALDYYDNKGK
jgi:hypothetical protein